MDQISLDTAPPEQQISLDTAAPINQDTAKTRTTKAWMGLGDVLGQDYDNMYTQISGGQEDSLRKNAASTLEYKRIKDAVSNKNLTPEDLDSILKNKINPDTIIEQAYSQSYLNKVKESSDRVGGDLNEVQNKTPEVTKPYYSKASDILSIREFALKHAQDINSEVQADPYLRIPVPTTPITPSGEIGIGSHTAPISSLLNWATLGIYGGLREEYLTRGNTPETSRLAGVFEGSNIAEQAQELLNQPSLDAAQEMFLKGFNRLKEQDPTIAQQWAMGIAGMSADDITLRNAMSGLNIAGAITAGQIGKDLLKGIGKAQLKELGRPLDVEQVQRRMEMLKEGEPLPLETPELWAVQRNMEDVLKAAPESPTKANIAEAIGDTKEAAVQRTLDLTAHPDPEKEALDTMLQMHRVQRENIERNPGMNSREETTRMLDAVDGSMKETAETLLNDEKNLVRLPGLAENGYRDIADRVKQYFKGLENTVVNIDMFKNRVTNTIHHMVTMGDYSGRPFISLQQATNAAKNRGIDGARIVGNDPNIVYLSKEDVTHPGFTFENKEGNWSFNIDTSTGEYSSTTGKTEKLVKGTAVANRVNISPSVHPIPTYIPFDLQSGKFGKALAEGPHIVPEGIGYYIKWYVPLKEDDDLIRDAHLITGPRTRSSSTSRGFVSDLFNGSFLGYFRLPADTLSLAESENRAKLVYGESKYFKLIMQDMKYVQDLYSGLLDGEGRSLSYFGNLTGRNKQVWSDFKRALTVAQKYPDPDTGKPGYYFKTPLEIQHFWQTSFGRPASVAEQQAYLAVQRMDFQDWIFRNIGEYKNRSRIGVMEHTLITDPIQGGERIRSKPFEGQLISSLPGGEPPVAIHNRDGSFSFLNSKNVQQKNAIKERFENGEIKGVKLYRPDTYPVSLQDAKGRPIRAAYILSENMETRPISYKQVGERWGGHWDYNYDHYAKVPIVREFNVGNKLYRSYEGDATIAPFKNKSDGEIFVKKWNNVKELLRKGKLDEAETAHKAYSDQDWHEFKAQFYPFKHPETGELMPPRMGLLEDARMLPKGYTVGEYERDFVTGHRQRRDIKFINAANGEQSPSRSFQIEYTGQRDSHDLFEPYNTGTIANPYYKFQPAELVDPLVTQTRALRRIINTASMDDYKYSAVEHWLQENMDKLDITSKAEARHSPFATFMNNDMARKWRWDLMGQAAQSNRYKIMKTIGMPTYMDSQIHMMKQALADEMARAENPLYKTALVVPSWLLHKVRNPTDFLRGMAFHENLGMFNWMQLASQNAAYVNFFAMAPGHAIPGVFGSWMHLWSRINNNPRILASIDRKAQLMGWKPGELLEAMRIYDNVGFGEIGKSLAIHDPDIKFLANNADKFLRTGSKYFFDLAEQNVRHGSWYTAFHEYKRAFPNKTIDSLEAGKILRRANDLYVNMGRDSKTALNTGITGVTLQFFKYIENVGQLFLSKRIGDVFGKENTWQLRAKMRAQMIAMYSMFFGPVGATGLSLLPANDVIRKQSLEGGYVPGSSFWKTLMMEGPASMAGAYASGWWRSGNADMSKGTFYNFNNRYGANGYQLLRDLAEGSPSFWKVILGASGSTLANNLSSVSPYVYAWKSAYNDEADNPFRLSYSDWYDGLKNVNSLRYAERLRYAIQFGKWLDRHGKPQDEVGKIDAIFRSLLGVNDVNLDDLYLMRQIQQDEKDNFNKAAQDFEHYRRLQDQAIENGDTEQALAYGKNAAFIIHSRGIPPEEFGRIMRQDASRNRDTKQATYDSFYHRAVPTTSDRKNSEAYQEHYRQDH